MLARPLNKARQELGLAVLATTHGNGQEARMIVDAHEALAREVARDEFAKLPPAPVGTDCQTSLAACIDHCDCSVTPPAEGSDGGEMGRWLARMNAPDDMLIYRRAGDGASISLGALRAADARIADLEARLAKSEDGAAYMSAQCAAKSERAEAAEHALAEATKRIEALERGLSEIRSLTQDDERYMRAVLNHIYDEADALLSPATDKGA